MTPRGADQPGAAAETPRRATWVLALVAGTLALAGCGASIRHVDQRPAEEHVRSDAGRLAVGLDDVQVTALSLGLALGTPVRFRNLPGLRPRASLVLVAGRPVDPGWGDDGTGYASLPAGQVWPSASAEGTVAVRFVNVPVSITNVGRAPLRVMLAGSVTDEQGRDAGEINRRDSVWPGPHGRRPDWTSRLGPPIEPGWRATRFITFPIAQGSQPIVFSFWPMPVSSSGETTSTSPESVSFRAP